MTADAARWQSVNVDGAQILAALDRPAAIVRTPEGPDIVASWPDLACGTVAVTATVLGARSGAWVFYRPLEAEHSTPDAAGAAVHVTAKGEVSRFERVAEHQVLGVTPHGLWLTGAGFPDPEDDAAWHAEGRVTVLGSDGRATGLAVDARVAFVLDDAPGPARIVLYDGPPAALRDGLRGTSYAYRYVVARLPAGLPDALRVSDLETEPFDESELMRMMSRVTPQPVADPPADPGIRWRLITLTPEQTDAATRAVLDEFAHLADYWHASDGETSPLSRGLADPRVEAIGEWPDTRVEVSFTHPHYPAGRLRRTIRVFDDAGRIAPPLYSSIHLMEDLDTGALPDPATARGGVLDV